jgi:hypothetical protein
MLRLERMVSRSRVIRAGYRLREAADAAAQSAQDARDSMGYTTSNARWRQLAEDAHFHTGRQSGLLTALKILDSTLEDK